MFEPWTWALLALPWPFFWPKIFLPSKLFLSSAEAPLSRPITELRVDVQWSSGEVDEELSALHARLFESGLLQHGTEIIPVHIPGLVFRHREADGEHYVYVEDTDRACLAGYTVFNRLIEVNRRWDRFVRAPHSKYAQAYQQRGIATAVYEWALSEGFV